MKLYPTKYQIYKAWIFFYLWKAHNFLRFFASGCISKFPMVCEIYGLKGPIFSLTYILVRFGFCPSKTGLDGAVDKTEQNLREAINHSNGCELETIGDEYRVNRMKFIVKL